MPPPTAAPRPGATPPVADSAPRFPVRPPLRRTREERTRRTPRWAYAGSILFHLLLVVAAVLFLRFGPRPGASPPPVASGGETVEYFDLGFPEETGPAVPAGAPAAAAPQVPTPAERERPGPAGAGEELLFPAEVPSGVPPAGGAPAAPGGVGGAPGGTPGGSGTGGSVLRPGLRDPRLHAPGHAPAAERPLTEHERYLSDLYGKLGAHNDSVAAEQERARRATDWTVKDKDGRRWGISPGKIHLGGVTLPAPFDPAVGSPRWDDREREEAGQRREIDRQALDRQRRDSFSDRVKATRERKDAERQARRGGT